MINSRQLTFSFALLLSIFLSAPSFAQTQEEPAPAAATAQDTAEPEMSAEEKRSMAIFTNAIKAATAGPAKVAMIDQATLNLPANYLFVPKKEAAALMSEMGNETGDEFVGLVMRQDNEFSWFITVDYIDSGYISDSEAKDWNADDLLKEIKEGTEAANEERTEQGFPAMDIAGWVEKPNYNFKDHRLVWSILGKIRGAPVNEPATINYNTYALGRQGYFQLDLVTDSNQIEQNKIHALTILNALQYNTGKSYADFVVGKDRVAEYGLAALVAGVAAKKLGMLAIAAAFILKIWKLALLAGVVLLSKGKAILRAVTGKKDNGSDNGNPPPSA